MSDETTSAEPTEPTEQNEGAMPPAGRISKVGMLDLRSAKTPEDLAGITGISEVGCILIPEHLATTLATIPQKSVGSVIPLPQDANLKLHTGQIKMSGEALAAGNPEDTLCVIGQFFITTPVTAVGYKEVWVHGQMLAVRGSEAALGSKMGRMEGQTLYIAANPRILMGEETLDKEFLELLPEPQALVIMGDLTFAADVTPELLRSKISEIVLMGCIHAPAHLLAQVKVLTVEKMGEIVRSDEA